jgi:hypothetical protein
MGLASEARVVETSGFAEESAIFTVHVERLVRGTRWESGGAIRRWSRVEIEPQGNGGGGIVNGGELARLQLPRSVGAGMPSRQLGA